MKLVFVNRYFYPDHSATSQLLGDLAFFLAARGMDVMVVTSRQRYDAPDADLPSAEHVAGVRIRRLWTSRFGRGTIAGRAVDFLCFYVGAATCLLLTLRKDDLVIAKTDPPMMSVVVAPVAKMRAARLVNWCQDIFPEVGAALGIKFLSGGAGRLLRNLRNRSLRGARVNVVLGDRMAQRVSEAGVDAERISVIHNWSDGDLIRPVDRETNALRRKWGLEGRFVVGYSGNLGRAHEVETILEAAFLLRERRDIVFLFVGGGAQRKWLEREVLNRDLDNIRFEPYQNRSDLAASLGVPDLHLISLRPELEGFVVPSKFYGVVAAGRPSLFIGDTGGELAIILKSGSCGFSVAPGERHQAAEIITKLAADPVLCAALGDNARRVFEQRFDKAIAMRLWLDVIMRARNGAHEAPKGRDN